MKSALAFAIASVLTLSTACNAYGQNPPRATVLIESGDYEVSDDLQTTMLRLHAPVTFTTDKDSAIQIVTLSTVTKSSGPPPA